MQEDKSNEQKTIYLIVGKNRETRAVREGEAPGGMRL
jgi:hypothetical protein